jgi:hypothetical protein
VRLVEVEYLEEGEVGRDRVFGGKVGAISWCCEASEFSGKPLTN